jgi:hypothetical protein
MLSQSSFTNSIRSEMGSCRSSWIDAFIAAKFTISAEFHQEVPPTAELVRKFLDGIIC